MRADQHVQPMRQGRAPAASGLNNASEHFIKRGQEHSEAAVLRLLADIYKTRGDHVSMLRRLERASTLTGGLNSRKSTTAHPDPRTGKRGSGLVHTTAGIHHL